MKSNHNYNSNISYEELKYFIEPIKQNTQIPYCDLSINNCLFLNETKDSFIKELDNVYLSIIKYMPDTERKTGKNSFIGITHNSHVNGYDFRFNPITTVNNIYDRFKLNYRIPFIDLDQEIKMDYFKNYVKNCNKDIRRNILDSRIRSITHELDGNIERICNLYNYPLEEKLKKIFIPKNVLFYLANRNLKLYKYENNMERTILPYEYYNYVSCKNGLIYPTSEFPKTVFFSNKNNKYWYPEFIDEYESIIGKDYIPSKLDILTGKEEVLAVDVLKPGVVEKELKV